jgi:type IX secretion system PorP/SprF family membrane protein
MNISKSNIDEVLFDYFEGNLSVQDKLQVEKFIGENPSFQKDFDAWESSFVQDENLQFKNVDALLANEESGKTPWFKWGLSSLLLILLSFLSYAVYFEFSGKKEKALANNDNNTNNNSGEKSSKGMLIKEDAPTVNTIVKEEKNNTEVNDNNNNNNINNNNAVTINPSAPKNHTKDSHRIKNSSSYSISKPFATNNNTEQDPTNVSSLVEDDSKLQEINTNIKGWSLFNHSIVNAIDANFSSKKQDEMNNKPGSFELINLNDPFVIYGGVAPIQENPSFTGNANGIRLKSVSRWEWPELGSASFITNAVSIDAYAPQVKGGLGLVLSSDIMGGNKYAANGITLVYSPKIKVGNISIEPSVKYGLTNRTINWSSVGTGDFIDPRTGTLLASSAILPENTPSSNLIVNSFGAGFLLNHDVFYAGFAVDNLFSPSYKNELFDQAVKVPLKITAQLGTDIRKNAKSPWIYSPSVSIRNQGLYNKVWMCNMVRYKKVLAGAHFSTADAMMFSVGFSNSTFRATYSYGLSTVPFNTNSTSEMISSHQLTMRYIIKK